MNRSFSRLEGALDAASTDCEFFFRDDDAGWADDELFDLCDRFVSRAPIDLAIIPNEVTRRLGGRLIDHGAELGFHQHGYRHQNHEPVGKKCEFGPSRSTDEIVSDLCEGRARLVEIFGDRVDPIFTPPWNRCTHATVAALGSIGMSVLSRDRGSPPVDLQGMIELPVSVDWVRCRDTLDEAITRSVSTGSPTGVMLHHEVMDGTDLSMIDDLLELLADHPRASANSMMQLVGGGHGS